MFSVLFFRRPLITFNLIRKLKEKFLFLVIFAFALVK